MPCGFGSEERLEDFSFYFVGHSGTIVLYFNDDLIVFPNPTEGLMNINLRMHQAGKVKVEVVDMTGRVVSVVYEGNISTGIQSFRLEETLPAGQYLVRAVSADNAVTQPVVVFNR